MSLTLRGKEARSLVDSPSNSTKINYVLLRDVCNLACNIFFRSLFNTFHAFGSRSLILVTYNAISYKIGFLL